MAVSFHQLKVRNIRRETPECVSVSLEVPEESKSDFVFRQGQYLTFRHQLNGEEIRRSYSICASPLDGELRVAVKKVPEGVFSTYVNESLQVGDTVEVMQPEGRFFTELDATNEKMYVAFAAGSGITPVISIIKTVLLTEPKSKFCLVYGNKTRGSIIFKSEIEDLKNQFMGRFSVYHILSREQADAQILSGRIDRDKCRYFLDKIIRPEDIDECFLCGPEDMINDVKEVLTGAGVSSKKIHFELFFTSSSLRRQAAEKVPYLNDSISKVTVKLDGSYMEMELGYHGESILDAALKNGADLPFACKGGVCATCRAKVEKGSVEMDINYALEQDELDAGFVLTCQAHPRSENVLVNFDIR